jgi:hypothetical protein
LETPTTKKGLGVSQGVGPEFKPYTAKKKKKNPISIHCFSMFTTLHLLLNMHSNKKSNLYSGNYLYAYLFCEYETLSLSLSLLYQRAPETRRHLLESKVDMYTWKKVGSRL